MTLLAATMVVGALLAFFGCLAGFGLMGPADRAARRPRPRAVPSAGAQPRHPNGARAAHGPAPRPKKSGRRSPALRPTGRLRLVVPRAEPASRKSRG